MTFDKGGTSKPRQAAIGARRRRSAKEGQRITLEDVARASGLSTATISRTLNLPDRVTEQTRKKVAEAISQLGYVPDGVARALAMQSTKIIGAIVPTIENSIFANYITAFQRRLSLDSYTLLLATTEYETETEFAKIRAFIERGVEGIALVGEDHDEVVYRTLEARRIPFINTWLYHEDAPYPSCGFDHEESTRAIVDHLADLGHTRFAVVTGHIDRNDRAATRLRVVIETARQRGFSIPKTRILETDYSVRAARRATRTLMESNDRATAIIAGNDILALGAIFEARSMGLQVPRDLSVFGHGDFEFAAEFTPALSTLRLPDYDIGHRAAEYLLARIAGHAVVDHIRLPTTLQIRETTAPPPATL